MIKVQSHNDNKEEIDKALALPLKLMTDDGREIAITEWTPSAKVACFISVEIKGIVRIDP